MDMTHKVIKQGFIYIPSKLKIDDDIDIVLSVTEQIRNFIMHSNILLVSIELPAFSASSNRSKQLNMLFGSILQGFSLPYTIVNATTLKKYATGKGRHPKEENKTVMIKAWENQDKVSYLCVTEYLKDSYLKSVITRAMGDIADSYWLAHYAVTNYGEPKNSNPEPILVEIRERGDV